MKRFDEGDRVRIDIPDESDPDYDHHGAHGEIIEILEDDGGILTGDKKDDRIYRVELGHGMSIDVRWRNLRPPIDEE